jgi:ADP-ribose pyrophosphatase
MKFELIKSEQIYKGRGFGVRLDYIRTPNGDEIKYDIVDHVGSISIVPVDENGQVYFVRQYRPAIKTELLELPAGTLNQGENPLDAAGRATREEIGMAAKDIKEIGSFYLAPGYSTELMHVYLATGLTDDPLEPDSDEFLSVEKMSLQQALALAESGQLLDAKSVASLFLARKYFNE